MTQSATEGESPSSNHLPHLPEQVSIPPHRLSQSDRTSSSVSQPGKGERKLGSRKRSVARADHELENKENQGTSSSTNSHRDCESVASKNATSTKPPVVGPENKSVRVQLSDGPDLVTAASPERHTDRPLSSASAKSNANPAAPKNRGMTRKSPKKVTIQKTPADRHVGEGTEAQESNRAHPRHLPGTSTRASSAGKPGDDTSTKPANGRSTKPGGDHATKPTGSRSAKLALETPLPPTADVPTLNESGTQEAKPKAKSKATPRSQTKRASKGSSNQEKG
ncbi:hypothetical protein M427DRAFT_54343 [Gonapodya prolifera JEL478]|uniref:Uncharacterized protein n=1 Tax=Gonapodya prolifera (strain JEL478) TaxID=1344416 RepID=A0A139AM29_GONPJ|nr:hypothetical protein M427DRAFT_54343 [Gonapodya prolifera JEL478]|eukprot:KXS17748.1 hypothetical protein M427DRAFT_54343 [Gonapodya prolifera JEL478]